MSGGQGNVLMVFALFATIARSWRKLTSSLFTRKNVKAPTAAKTPTAALRFLMPEARLWIFPPEAQCWTFLFNPAEKMN